MQLICLWLAVRLKCLAPSWPSATNMLLRCRAKKLIWFSQTTITIRHYEWLQPLASNFKPLAPLYVLGGDCSMHGSNVLSPKTDYSLPLFAEYIGDSKRKTIKPTCIQRTLMMVGQKRTFLPTISMQINEIKSKKNINKILTQIKIKL